MSLCIQTSAPGKTILHGEHTVCFGKKAIAVSVDLRTNVKITIDETIENIYFSSSCFPEKFFWSLQELDSNKIVSKKDEHKIPYFDDEDSKKLDVLLKKFKFENSFSLDSAKSFLFLYFNIAKEYNNSNCIALDVEITSDLPMASGMGSSASFSVSLTGALLKAFKATNLNRDLICKWSFNVEKIFHGNPSGIDNSVCTYGGAILFEKNKVLEKLDKLENLNLGLVYTNVSRNTKELVKKTTNRRNLFPEIINHIIESIDKISNLQWSFLKENKNIEDIENLIEINQSLLNSMGAGHSTIDNIVSISKEFGLASKLTGAGGGGTVLILLKPDFLDQDLEKLKLKLINNGYRFWKVEPGTSGFCLDVLENGKKKKIF